MNPCKGCKCSETITELLHRTRQTACVMNLNADVVTHNLASLIKEIESLKRRVNALEARANGD